MLLLFIHVLLFLTYLWVMTRSAGFDAWFIKAIDVISWRSFSTRSFNPVRVLLLYFYIYNFTFFIGHIRAILFHDQTGLQSTLTLLYFILLLATPKGDVLAYNR